MTDRNEVADLQARYKAAMHAVQSGVAWKMGIDPAETSPKHLRVGVNSALLQSSALVRLLMDKGLITELEYWTAIAQAAEDERRLYEEWLANATNARVTLS